MSEEQFGFAYSVALLFSNMSVAVRQLQSDIDPLPAFRAVFLSDIRRGMEAIAQLYLMGVDQLLTCEQGWAHREARDQEWFADTIREVGERGYNAQMFYCGAYSICLSIVEGEDCEEGELALLSELCEIIVDSIEEYSEIEEGESE